MQAQWTVLLLNATEDIPAAGIVAEKYFDTMQVVPHRTINRIALLSSSHSPVLSGPKATFSPTISRTWALSLPVASFPGLSTPSGSWLALDDVKSTK